MNVTIALIALLVEAAAGYPKRLFRWLGHPVMWIGYMIGWLDGKFNRPDRSAIYRKTAGFMAAFCIVMVPGAIGFGVQREFLLLPGGFIVAGVVGSALLAQRSLYEHVAHVADALEKEGLAGGRKAVALIVGRDPDALDEAGVARAAIESLAENFSDGVVAPVFWFAIGGLGGAAAYKAINTADSMIGHRTARHADFGFAAARLDDLVNLPASRLSALLIIMAACISANASAARAWKAVRRDARRHRSPNAGYPEAAMAGALGLALAGPRIYGGVSVIDAFMGDGRRAAKAEDIRAALALYRLADAILIIIVVLIAAAVIATG
jgi:adenosylcobinamide-phosphate synthase